ncbi:MAG: radical SAM protein [Gaiellales bacterium]|nr:MAG: radical SAM protein [Gaiellales bacterium]
MRIVLADPPLTGDRQADMISYPNIGVLSLFGYLRERLPGHELIYVGSLDIGEHVERIASLEPDVYGVSFATCMEKLSYELINRVRERLPRLPIITGGPHPTALPAEVMENCEADICVVGEGEQTFLEVVGHIMAGGDDWGSIPGLAYRHDGEIVFSEPRGFLPIADIPMPAWDLVDLGDYMGNQLCKNKPGTCILTSRGCPYDCVFCSNPVWKSARPWLRMRAPESIAAEVDYLYGRGVRELYIRADEFNADLKWSLEVCRAIAALGHTDLYFQCNLRADKVDDELAAALVSINCWMVHLGIESWNQRVLDGIEKHIKVEDVISACRTLKRAGISVYGFLMLYQVWEEDGELRWETADEVDHTIRTTRRMMKSGLLDYMSWQFATPFPGSRMYDIVARHDLVRGGVKGVWDMSLRLPGISERRMKHQRLKGFIIQSYYSLRSGGINWRFWRRILNKLKYMVESV